MNLDDVLSSAVLLTAGGSRDMKSEKTKCSPTKTNQRVQGV